MKLLSICVVLIFVGSGCAFSNYSRGELNKGSLDSVYPQGTKLETVVEDLGPPNKSIRVGQKNFLTYTNKSGAFVLIAGYTSETDFDFVFENGELISSRAVPAGGNVGIGAGQGLAGN